MYFLNPVTGEGFNSGLSFTMSGRGAIKPEPSDKLSKEELKKLKSKILVATKQKEQGK